MKVQSFLPGERVKWFTYYAEMIVKEAGYGTVIGRETLDLGLQYVPDPGITMYDVLKDGGKMERFESFALESCPDSSAG